MTLDVCARGLCIPAIFGQALRPFQNGNDFQFVSITGWLKFFLFVFLLLQQLHASWIADRDECRLFKAMQSNMWHFQYNFSNTNQ